MIWAGMVGVILGTSDLEFLAALLAMAVLLIPKAVAEVVLRDHWPLTGTSPYVDFRKDLEHTGDLPEHPALSYIAQFTLNGGFVAVVIFGLVRLLF